MSPQPSGVLVDGFDQKEMPNLPQRQTLFYACVYTAQYAGESPARGTLIDDKLRSFNADFIKLGDELRRERRMKVVNWYTRRSSGDQKGLLSRRAVGGSLERRDCAEYYSSDRLRPHDTERPAMSCAPTHGSRVGCDSRVNTEITKTNSMHMRRARSSPL
ncbi:hypothetical protein BDV26DRAFT_298760 [Aspergillus bertholletiae]|uniref:Uncharacterized protein n=1 Tax=Aspergillus bertholletiae TaxID=1226010 RepID=A0A5N7ANP4_9EURO|nr:hypothetical protein BDV26DRAFT_298760 [Aspergillus bertholletiae]